MSRDTNTACKVKCPSCGAEMMNIGYKIPIPPKTKGKEWKNLQKQLISEMAEAVSKSRVQNVQLLHSIEKELRKLEALPANKGREVLIKQLKKRLENARV